jgi:hypothetical protein
MDNFYTGVGLLEEMRTHAACGTVRANRKGLPKSELLRKKASLNKHEYRVAQMDDLTFCIWQDTKTVMVLSNHHDPTETGTVNRRKDGGEGRGAELHSSAQWRSRRNNAVEERWRWREWRERESVKERERWRERGGIQEKWRREEKRGEESSAVRHTV